MPGPLSAALVLVHSLFVIAIVGGLGLLATAASYDAVDGGLLALVAYGAAPGVLGWWLARRSRSGGVRVWRGLVAVQIWLVLGGVANFAAGSLRGGTQLVVPILVLCFLIRPGSREWYRLARDDRAGRRRFSVARMLRRRRGDEGQSSAEYLGLVVLVVAVVLALLLSGIGARTADSLEAQVCRLTGSNCAAGPGDGGTDNEAGKDPAGGTDASAGTEGSGGDGGDTAGAGGTDGTGSGGADGGASGTGANGGASEGNGSGSSASGGSTSGSDGTDNDTGSDSGDTGTGTGGTGTGGTGTGGSGDDAGAATGGASGSSNGGQQTGGAHGDGENGENGGDDGGEGDDAGADGEDAGNNGGDDGGGNADARNDDGGDAEDGDDGGGDDQGCFSGVGAFFGCAGDQVKQVGEGLFVDGVWGDLTGMYDMVRHPVDTFGGLADYGRQIGDAWWQNAENSWDKASEGDILGAVVDYTGGSLQISGGILYDTFIGDDVADRWNEGNETRAVTTVIWNVGSLFIPGYDVAKVVEKAGVLGKLGKLGKLADEAGDAAAEARRAAEAGDVKGAEKAAEDADDAADEAERKARESGCTLSAPARRVPYGAGRPDGTSATVTGSSGTGTTVLAAGPSALTASSPYVVLADGGCDEEARKEAEEARDQADDAARAANRWEAGDDVAGPAAGKTLRFPHRRHTVGGAAGGQVREHNTVILRGNEDLVREDVAGIAKGRGTLLGDANTYEINGRRYRVEDNGTVFPVSGPGLVEMDRVEYAALKEIARNKGDISRSQQLQRDPKFVDNPEKVEKAKQVYDGTYR